MVRREKAKAPAPTQPLEGSEQTVSEERARREMILLTVSSIPAGRVATYGEIAAAAGLPGRARLVGRVMATLPEGSRIPWHRVVAAGGRIAERPGSGMSEQFARLRAEGVAFRRRAAGSAAPRRVDLERASWNAPD